MGFVRNGADCTGPGMVEGIGPENLRIWQSGALRIAAKILCVMRGFWRWWGGWVARITGFQFFRERTPGKLPWAAKTWFCFELMDT